MSKSNRMDYSWYNTIRSGPGVIAGILESKVQNIHAVAQILGYYAAQDTTSTEPPLLAIMDSTHIQFIFFPFTGMMNACVLSKMKLFKEDGFPDRKMLMLILSLTRSLSITKKFQARVPDCVKECARVEKSRINTVIELAPSVADLLKQIKTLKTRLKRSAPEGKVGGTSKIPKRT